MGKLKALGLAAALCFAAAPPAAAKDVAGFAVTPGGPDAMIVFKAPDIPRPPGYKTSWRMGMQGYDPAEEKLQGGPFGGNETLAGRPKSFVDSYLVEMVKPGTYVFRDFSRQDHWSLCFNGASLQFTIKPGEVLYLGEFNAAKHALELETLSVTTGQTMSFNGRPIQFFDTVSPPAFTAPDEAALAAAAAMVKARMPKTTVAPKFAMFSPARFGTGKDLFGTQRLCGGYYTKKAKPAED
jgi:hypothetical protein